MNNEITRHNLFQPPKSKGETKAAITDHTARAIIEAEARSRREKTERLRQARLENEALAPPAPPPARKRAAKGTARRAKPAR